MLWTNKQTNKQTNRQTEKQTDKQTDGLENPTLADRHSTCNSYEMETFIGGAATCLKLWSVTPHNFPYACGGQTDGHSTSAYTALCIRVAR